jgi:phage-related protein
MADGSFIIDTRFDTSGAEQGINGLTSSLKRLGGFVAKVFAVGALINFGKQAIELASDIAEVDNVVQKAFGNMRGEMDALADTAIEKLGMSRLTAYQTGSTFMSMGRSMLDSAEDAKNMALELTKLTGNMSSFFNVSQDLAGIALKSIYTGETETLKQYGVVMTETNLKEFAMAQGITKSYNAMTQSEKVMLRYNYVMNQLNYIGDDFIDTQDSWANQTRILKEQWKEFMSVIGSTLISVLTPAIKMLNNVVSTLINATKALQNALSSVFGIQIQSMSGATEATYEASGAMDSYGDSIAEAGKKAKKNVAGFDELSTLAETSGNGGSGSGGSGGISLNTSGISSSIENVASAGGIFADIFSNIKEYINSINFDPLLTAFDTLKTAVEPFIGYIGDGLTFFLDEILKPLGKWTIEKALPASIDIFSGALKVLSAVIEKLKPFATYIWEEFLKPIAKWTGDLVVKALEGIANALNWIAGNDTAVSILTAIVEIAGTMALAFGAVNVAIGIYNGVIAIATTLSSAFGAVVAFLTSPIGIATVAITALIAIGVALYKNWQTVSAKAKEIWGGIKTTIVDIMTTIKGKIYSIMTAIKNVWNVIWTSISNTTSDIFNGIWDVIKGVINGIIGGIEWMANAVVAGINLVIDALNMLSFDIPDWVPELGGKKFGFSISHLEKIEIPRLATGAVLPANNPFLAVVGDQKSGTNVEAPLDTIKQALYEVMQSTSGGNGDVYINATGDVGQLVRFLKFELSKENNRSGKSFVKAGVL